MNLSKEAAAVGRAWNPKAAAAFNERVLVPETRERLARNIAAALEIKGYKTPEDFQKVSGLSEILLMHILAGMPVYVHTCFVAAELGYDLEQLLTEELVTVSV